jgi:hypothetical protein
MMLTKASVLTKMFRQMIYTVTRLMASCLLWLVITNVVQPVGRSVVHGHTRSETSATEVARVGRKFKIKVGRRVTFRGESLRLKFVSVENDSRCPTGVTCVWAGNAEVLIEVSARGVVRETLKLNTNRNGQAAEEGKYQRYTVKLLELSPYPRSGRKIAAGAYTATLLVSKE